MVLFWFWAIAVMLAIYAVLDGFDIGAGIVHLFVARNDTERRLVLRSIGPVWDGNEVWLIAAGGTLFMAFPTLYASSFSGFYLPLVIVLWFLILRGIAIEFRSELASPVWSPFWDVVFAGASAGLAGFYGVAIGNVVRGVSLDHSGFFFLPLWTDFRVGRNVGILDWFTILVGLATFFAMALHGSLWVALKTDGELEERCRRAANFFWWPVLLFTGLIPTVSPMVQPHLLERIAHHPWGYVFPALALAGLAGMRYFNRDESSVQAFVASSLYMLGIATSTAFGLCPYVLPSTIDPRLSLSIVNAAAPPMAQRLALFWFIPGIILALVYLRFGYWGFAGKVKIDDEGY